MYIFFFRCPADAWVGFERDDFVAMTCFHKSLHHAGSLVPLLAFMFRPQAMFPCCQSVALVPTEGLCHISCLFLYWRKIQAVVTPKHFTIGLLIPGYPAT
jgi:hypothetical protein